MIEVYVENRQCPKHVEETVKDIGDYTVEHADNVSCIHLPAEHPWALDLFVELLDVITVKGATNERKPASEKDAG